MKIKFSKRLLSAFLAVMMVVTSVPMMSFTALAADSDAAVVLYDAGDKSAATVNDDSKGKVIDVSKHLSSSSVYTPAASSTGYTISFDYNPMDLGNSNGTILNIGNNSTAGKRAFFELLEGGAFHFCWDIAGDNSSDNYVDAYSVFADKLTANAWHNIQIVVTPNGSYDIINFYVDGVNTASVDTSSAEHKVAGKSVSAYLAEARAVNYGAGCGYWNNDGTTGNANGYIDNVLIRTNGAVTIDVLKQALTAYETKMNGTVLTNMGDAYAAYVTANKAYDSYYYGAKTDINIADAFYMLQGTANNMTPWTAYKGNAVPTLRDDNGSVISSQYYNNLLYSKNDGNVAYSETVTHNSVKIDWQIFYSETVMMYTGDGDRPFTPVAAAFHKATNASSKARYIYQLYPCNSNGDKSDNGQFELGMNAGGYSNGNWLGRLNYGTVSFNGILNSGNGAGYIQGKNVTASTSERLGQLENKVIPSNAAWSTAINTIRYKAIPSSIMESYTPTWYRNSGGNTAGDDGYAATSTNLYIFNYKMVLDAISNNSSKLDNVDAYKQGGLENVIAGYEKAIVDPNSYFTSSNGQQACADNFKSACDLMNGAATADKAEYQAIREAMTTALENAAGETAIPMDQFKAGNNKGYIPELWSAFETAYQAAQDAMAKVYAGGYAAISSDLATNVVNTFKALALPEVTLDPPVINLADGTYIGAETSITVSTAVEGAKIKYSVVYDGAPAVTASTDYTDGIIPFNGSDDHETATVYAIAELDGVTSSPVSATYKIIKAPALSVATGSAIASTTEVAVTALTNKGALEYSINGGNWMSCNGTVVPFAGLRDTEVTLSVRETVNGISSKAASATYVRAASTDLAITTEMGHKVGADSTITITDPENINTDIKYIINVNGDVKSAATYTGPICVADLGDVQYIIVTAWREYQGESAAVKKTFVSDSFNTLVYRESFDNTSINGLTFNSSPDLGAAYSGKFTEEAGSVVEGAGNIDGNANGYNWTSGWRENALKINANASVSQHLELANPLVASEENKVSALNNGITFSYWRYVENNGAVVGDITDGSYWYTGLGFKASASNDEYFLASLSGRTTLLCQDGRYQDIYPTPQDKTEHAAGNHSGQWMNIVVTVDPNVDSNNVMVYTNGEPHEVELNGAFGNSKDFANRILNFVTRQDTVITVGDNGKGYWANKYDTYFDDIRVYAEVLTQVDINNMYTDEYADVQSKKAVGHDPTTVTSYTLADGRTVGQEYMDANPGTAYTKIEYYMFGTGMTVYKSDDAVNWTVVGDNQGRCGYQNQQLFGAEYTTALAGPLGWAAASTQGCEGAGYLVWAPHVMYNTSIGKWCFYGSTSAWDAFQSEIFMGTSDNITGPYTNIKSIARSQFDANKSWDDNGLGVNAIDPATFYAKDGTLYLVYGSYQSGLALKKLNADGTAKGGDAMLIANTSASLDDGGVVKLTESAGIGSGEGGFVKYENGYYYLYVAFSGNGWGYTQRVFRSQNPTGPYYGINNVEGTSTINNDEKMRGNQIMSSYLLEGSKYINSGTGHNSVFNAQNAKGELVTLQSVHSRPLATAQTGKMAAIEDGAMITRQSHLSGNNTIMNLIGYTESGWPVALPLEYNGTDTFNLGDVSARDLAGIYTANDFEIGLQWNTYNAPYTYNVIATSSKTGIVYGTEQDGDIFTYNFEIIDRDNKTFIRFTDKDGKVLREGIVAAQTVNGETIYEWGILNNEATSSSYGKNSWGYRVKDVPNADASESAGDVVAMDQIIYTHLSNDVYSKYGQEISDDPSYDARTHNYGERATRIKVQYPYYIDTANPTSIYCYSDEALCAEYGCSGSIMTVELVNDVPGEYREYILKGSVSNYFKYNADTDSYTNDGVTLLITYVDENTGKTYSEFEFPYVMPNPSMAHSIVGTRNQNNPAIGNDKRLGLITYSRFTGSEGAATDVVSSLTLNGNGLIKNYTADPVNATGTFKYLGNFGDSQSVNDDYTTPDLIADKFYFFNKTEGVNAGSYALAEHNDSADGVSTMTSSVVNANYYLDYSDPDNTMITRDANGAPTGYALDFLVSNIQWKNKRNPNAATSYYRNSTGLDASWELLTYNPNYVTSWDSKIDDYSNEDVLGYGDERYGRKVMSTFFDDPANYNDTSYKTGLTKAFDKISNGGNDADSKVGSEKTNEWNGKITLKGKYSLVPRTDTSSAETYANFIYEKGIYRDNWNDQGGEEVYSYFNVGVNTCDKGAVREFVETFANKNMTVVRDENGRIQTIIPGDDIKSGEFSLSSYREYLETIANAFYFVENPHNTTYVDTDGATKEYTTAYGKAPDGDWHALIYTDDNGSNIFGDAYTNTDPVQAKLIEDVIEAYDNLFTKETYIEDETVVSDAKEFIENTVDGTYTDETVADFESVLGESAQYFNYYLDTENPIEDQEYWRYVTLTGSEYKELVKLIEEYKESLMPVVDSTELQTQIDDKTPVLNGGIYGENENGERVQLKTMTSWLDMNDTISKGKQDKIDTAGNAKYETFAEQTEMFMDKAYTYAKPNTAVLSADQILVDNDAVEVKATELKDCDDSSRYDSYDAAEAVVKAMERDRYTPEALVKFDEFVNQLNTGADLTQPSVYVLATDKMAADYNAATGESITAGTKLCATAKTETDPLTSAMLEMLNGLEVNLYTAYLTVQTIDADGNATAVTVNDKTERYYGEMFSFDTGADENAAVTWLVQQFNKGDAVKFVNGEDVTPVSTHRVSTYTGADMLRKADCDMKVTAQINTAETREAGIILKAYNGYNNIAQVIYAADLDSAKAELVEPRMPFYTFVEWSFTDTGNNVWIAKPQFDSTPRVTINVTEGNTLTGKRLSGNSAVSGSEVTVSTSIGDEFAAWAIASPTGYQIVSYNKSYTFVANADENYTVVTKQDGKYYVDGKELTAADMCQFTNTTDNGMTDDEYLVLKLDNKAPFVYKQSNDLGGRRILLRVTNGLKNESDLRAYGVIVFNTAKNTEKKFPATKMATSGQFSVTFSETGYAKYSNAPYDIQAYVTYSFSYEFNGNTYQINTTDYLDV